MKQIPNILSISRIFFSLLLLFFFKNPFVFIIIYIIAGFTDILDGFIARKYKFESVIGAKLDSIGDFVFYIILSLYLFVEQKEIIFIFWIPLLAIFIIKLGNVVIGILKYKKLIMIHTLANKITGFLVFLLPIIIIYEWKWYVLTTIIAVLLASTEELIILLKNSGEKIDLNKKSVFVD